jgi:MerR family redox-sensitive transcriptional activator SoxR
MALLTISQVAQQLQLRPSAIRYYEQIGILPSAQRISGQRRYDSSVLHRLAIVQQARQLGFTLHEIRELFFGFGGKTPASRRWQRLSQRKLAELDKFQGEIKIMQQLLRKMIDKCSCETLEQCGRGIFLKGCGQTRKEVQSRGRFRHARTG